MIDQLERVRKKAKDLGYERILLQHTITPGSIDYVIARNNLDARATRWVEYGTGSIARALRDLFRRLDVKNGGEPEKKKDFSREYINYLRSPDWREKRAAVIKRAGNKCEACKKFSHFPDVHHITYERFGHELLTDLMAVCRPCHEYIEHNKNAVEPSVEPPSSGSEAKGTPTAPGGGDFKDGKG